MRDHRHAVPGADFHRVSDVLQRLDGQDGLGGPTSVMTLQARVLLPQGQVPRVRIAKASPQERIGKSQTLGGRFNPD